MQKWLLMSPALPKLVNLRNYPPPPLEKMLLDFAEQACDKSLTRKGVAWNGMFFGTIPLFHGPDLGVSYYRHSPAATMVVFYIDPFHLFPANKIGAIILVSR